MMKGTMHLALNLHQRIDDTELGRGWSHQHPLVRLFGRATLTGRHNRERL
jgi:hypothetical protein